MLKAAIIKFFKKKKGNKASEDNIQGDTLPKVTVGWDFMPTIQIEGRYVLPRRAEMILHAKYYPAGTIGEWPCDPVTGEKLEAANI